MIATNTIEYDGTGKKRMKKDEKGWKRIGYKREDKGLDRIEYHIR